VTRCALLFPFMLCAALDAAGAPRGTYERGVVGLSITAQAWDPARPWAKRGPTTRHGSAVLVEGPYILTTAQMLLEATLIKLETFGRDTEVEPRVVLIDPDVDLALLSVDPSAVAGLTPVRLAEHTPSEGTLRTVRWVDQQLETSASRIRRFQVEEAYFGSLEHVFLLVQTDASSGGWAEPVFDGQRLVGLTANQDQQQRARIIPTEILSSFLRRARASEPYRGFPAWGVRWQAKTDRTTSEFFGQAGAPQGVLVQQVPWGSSGCGVLRPRDVLLAVDGRTIAGDGSYAHPRLGRVRFTHAIQEGHEVGDSLAVRVLRDRKVLDLGLTLRRAPIRFDLIPEHRFGEPPPYAIRGGFVFRELDAEYLSLWSASRQELAPPNLAALYLLERTAQRRDRRRVIILSSVLPAPYNVGYQDLRDLVVAKINGRPIASIADVVQAFDHPLAAFHELVFAPNPTRSEVILDAALLPAAAQQILENYGVPADARLPDGAPPEVSPDCADQ
jgi:hypothetical protein